MAQTTQSQRRRAGAARPRSGASRTGTRGGSSQNGRRAGGRPDSGDFLKEQAQKAGDTLRPIAEKAGKPALAAGAALAGLAAGLALAPKGSRRLSDLPDAARSVTTAGGRAKALLRTTRELHATACTINDVASEMRQLRELAQASRNRSPIEVVLQGLTRRPEP
jgi:hypothetical protein